MDKPKGDVLVALCKCGGWVMVSSLQHADADTWREAGRMAKDGYAIRSPVPFEEFRTIPACEHRGDCMSGVTQEALL